MSESALLRQGRLRQDRRPQASARWMTYYACFRPYFVRAATMTAVSVVPSAEARSCAARHTSSGMRTDRAGVFGWFGTRCLRSRAVLVGTVHRAGALVHRGELGPDRAVRAFGEGRRCSRLLIRSTPCQRVKPATGPCCSATRLGSGSWVYYTSAGPPVSIHPARVKASPDA